MTSPVRLFCQGLKEAIFLKCLENVTYSRNRDELPISKQSSHCLIDRKNVFQPQKPQLVAGFVIDRRAYASFDGPAIQ